MRQATAEATTQETSRTNQELSDQLYVATCSDAQLALALALAESTGILVAGDDAALADLLEIVIEMALEAALEPASKPEGTSNA